MKHDIRAVAARFSIPGDFVEAFPYGTGHINDTYAAVFRGADGPFRRVIQRINHGIFRDVPGLMENIVRVTSHLRAKAAANGGVAGRETLTVVPTVSGEPYLLDEAGNYWRAYVFIDGARTYDEVSSPSQAYEAARAFGLFQKALFDLPEPPLKETIPDFHHTPKRFARLASAVSADSCNRAREAAAEVEFALAREAMTSRVVSGLESGSIPSRVTHNDTKINNVMLDDADGRGVCVIDLDTVMPGSVLYDFGDQVRTTTATTAEDERDLGKVRVREDLFEQLVRGYLAAAGDFLVPAEIDALAFAGRLITFEIGMRFLTDFLEGDVYFKTHRPGHNLDRTRTQFEMVRQMETRSDEMERIVARYR